VFAFGFLGLFIGPVLLVVAYNLVDEWLEGGSVEAARVGPSAQA
jgi:predicted PurR-regulated permease PerM